MTDDTTVRPEPAADAAKGGAPRQHRLMIILDVYHERHAVLEAVVMHALKTIGGQLAPQLSVLAAEMLADRPLQQIKDKVPQLAAHCRIRGSVRDATPERYARAMELASSMVQKAEAMQEASEASASRRLN